ncbi:pyrophosphate--fructose 6-phosphate 1-phosphotransferase [Bacteroidia bacterium]|nr:pyrophosphate--fructose 6-phosphate 1-phosphotransferase [Bacteroidia bacterium]
MKTIAILCGGGPAPGINAVVATVAKMFLKDSFRVLAIHEGYKGLLSEHPEIEELTFEKADRMLVRGGSEIRMSRYKPKDEEFSTSIFEKQEIELLVTVGGDDTASTANRLSKYLLSKHLNVKTIHVPKTIDNDLPLPEGVPTFGFMSAREMGVNIAKVIKEEAATTQNWYVLVAMGREAGHLAFEIGKSIQASMIIIPEMFQHGNITVEKIVRLVVSSIVKRRILGMKSGVAVISEGILHLLKEEDVASYGIHFEYDAHGHPELSAIDKSQFINKLVMKRLKELGIACITRPIDVGYSLRCVDPVAADLSYCTTLGMGVKKLSDAGHSGCMVSVDIHQNIIAIPLKKVEDEGDGKILPRYVNMEREEVRSVFSDMLFYLTAKERQEAKQYIDNPEEYEWETIL